MKRRNLLFKGVVACSSALLLLAGEAAAAPGFPNPIFTTLPNAQGAPVTVGNPDPGMLVFQGRYITVSTGGRNYDSLGVPGNDNGCAFPIRASVDRRSWSDSGCVFLTNGAGGRTAKWPQWASGGFEAPQIYYMGASGNFIVVFAAIHRDRGSRCLGVAYGSNGQASDFTDAGQPLLCSNDTYQEGGVTRYASLIGPTLFTDRDGSRYLLYKWDTPAENKIRIRRLADPNNLFSYGDPVTILSGSSYAQTWEGGGVEAPSLVWNGGDGLYYLFYSGGFYQKETYAVGIARASSVLGGAGSTLYTKAPAGSVNPILRANTSTAYGNKFCGPGSADITWTPNEGWLIWYEAKIGSDGTYCYYPPRYLMMDLMAFTKADPNGRQPWPQIYPTV